MLRNANEFALSRRGLLKTSAAAGFVLAVEGPARAADNGRVIAGWIRIASDNTTTIFSNTSEIGQGTGTAIAQLVADELDAAWKDVRLEMAPLDGAHINPSFGEYATYGSGGIQYQADAFRTAGARARLMLIDAAALAWKVLPSECATEDGFVVHAKSKRKLAYGGLAEKAAALPVPDKPTLKAREAWRYIGKPVQRFDIPSKCDGTAVFGIDVAIPGMKIASIMQCPTFGGKLRSVDPAPALAIAGVERVVPMASAVAVVASGYWPARKGLDALKPQWDLTLATPQNSQTYGERLRHAVEGHGMPYAPRGMTVDALAAAHVAAWANAKDMMSVVYEAPFVSHATMEPMNATARPTAGGMELWLPTQAQTADRNAVAKFLGVPADDIIIHTTFSGGGFGRRQELDFPLQAAEIAHKIDGPVKLIWSREEDMQHDWYRPAAAIKIAAGLGADGYPLAWRFETACSSLPDSAQYRAYKLAPGGIDPSALEGLFRSPYSLASPRYGWTRTEAGVPTTYWRSVGQSQNIFALESFIDELAARAKTDPRGYRRKLLAQNQRALRVFDTVIEKSGWTTPAPAGRARGFAITTSNKSIVAQVAELSVTQSNEVRLHRITCVADCGLVINPNSVAAQMQGCIVFGLTAAFFSEITINAGQVQQSNFHDFPLATLAQVPDIEVTLLPSDEASGGAGEEAVAGLAPAVSNAIYAATGKRVRSLPFRNAGYTLA